MRMNDARRWCRQTKLPDLHPPPPYSLTADAPRDRLIRLLASSARSQFFAQNLAHLFRCERPLRGALMCPERIVDQCLISLPRAFRRHPKAIKHFIIQVDRDAGLSLRSE